MNRNLPQHHWYHGAHLFATLAQSNITKVGFENKTDKILKQSFVPRKILQNLGNMSSGYLKGFKMVPVRCIERVSKFSGTGLEGVLKVTGILLVSILKVSRTYLKSV